MPEAVDGISTSYPARGHTHDPRIRIPFCINIMSAPKEPKAKAPIMDAYDGNSDPDMHWVAYRYHIDSFFLSIYGSQKEKKTSMHLGRIQQGKEDSLRRYVKQFNMEAGQIPDLSDGIALDNFVCGLKKGSLKFDLIKKSVKTMIDVLDEAEAFIHVTEICSFLNESKSTEPSGPSKFKRNNSTVRASGIWAVNDKTSGAHMLKRERPVADKTFEYNIDLCTILMDVGPRIEIERPFLIKSSMENRDFGLFCQFHNDIGHDTKDCRKLKRALHDLASRGFLKQYLRKIVSNNARSRKESPTPLSEDEDIPSD
ncbi:uncharacterized protein [Spinacia oleracea]|uniref:Retrotransposon gag domain-containing protein n=1 Tax=Spinacia oleracea TaxID=3562 RepID=A0ABM3RIT6_SPIOL|nr:uncharacterized protein LOC130469995 [Spinacia oleracea]